MTFLPIIQVSGKFTLRHNSHLPAEDIAFANSMIIDSATRSFYVLAFPFFKYESSLQLLKGHLDDPGLEFAGNKIPYFFQDILSYADLFYCKTSHQLACVTLLNNNNNQTQVRLYTIGYPPSLVHDEPIGGR